jgi:hypothetical protein
MKEAMQTHSRGAQKPVLTSLDSCEECSLDHWLEVYWLVEDEYWFAKCSDSEAFEEDPSTPNLEVKASATDQNLAGDVVRER